MSAITNTPFSASLMNATDVVSSEAKGKKSGGGKGGSKPKNGPKKLVSFIRIISMYQLRYLDLLMFMGLVSQVIFCCHT